MDQLKIKAKAEIGNILAGSDLSWQPATHYYSLKAPSSQTEKALHEFRIPRSSPMDAAPVMAAAFYYEKEKTDMKDGILIAYYSWSGNTRKIAELIERETGGTLFKIEPVRPYTTDYGAAVAQAKEEIQAGFRPELKSVPEITSYTVVFLGTPIWWHTMAPPLAAFIDRVDLDDKSVVPFHTHGGGGVGLFEKDIANLCPDSSVTRGFGAYNSGGIETAAQISAWLSDIGLQPKK